MISLTSILPYYSSSFLQYILEGFIVFIISLMVCVFSPFGIGFIIFSFVRGFTKSQTARRVSLVFQIIFLVLTFLVGNTVAIYIAVSGGSYYNFVSWVPIIAIFLGIFFACIIELIVILWQGSHLRRKLGEF